MSDIIFLEVDDLILINKKVIKDYGGISGVRDGRLLDRACHGPQNLHFYQNAGLFEMAAGYACTIIQNHPFLGGNKRTGFTSMAIFLSQNGAKVNFPDVGEAVGIMVKIATGEIKFEQIVKWLKSIVNY